MKKHLLSLLLFCSCVSLSAQSDWAGYHVYAPANDTVTVAPEVVLMGNSITQMWLEAHPQWFVDHRFAPRGIGGQTSQHMLCRFQEDVIKLHPKKVMIFAGVNDIAHNNGEISFEHIVDNVLSMCQLAEMNGIQPYVCSPLPTNHFFWNVGANPGDSIARYRDLLHQMADREGYPFVDYYTPLYDPDSQPAGGMYKQYTMDGCHLYPCGYDVIEKVALEALAKPYPKKKKIIRW